MSKIIHIKPTKTLVERNRKDGGDSRLRVAAYCRVSTMEAEQQESFKSRVSYYTDLIKKNKDWLFAGVYADEGISGTTDRRPEFLKMINDAINGKIDLIMTKSISRFGRNTLDTLKYVRLLKDKGIGVMFEEEHVNTLSSQGEFMITILTSIAQQEVENTSSHVKKGLQMKMMDGKLVGYNACLGYDYDPATKSIRINPEEAKTVRFIFRKYCEGYGCGTIARMLEERGMKTKLGNTKWDDSTIFGIIKNEKYKGDLLQGKTFTKDPISGKRVRNYGEADQYYVSNHHEAIVDEDVWEKANEIRKKRSYSRKLDPHGHRYKVNRDYPFSSMLYCGFCGSVLQRRIWQSKSDHPKPVWHCGAYQKGGKKDCPHCKGIPEKIIEEAFVKAYNKVMKKDASVLDEIAKNMDEAFSSDTISKKIAEVDSELEKIKVKKEKLLSVYIEGNITKESYDAQYEKLSKDEEDWKNKRETLDFQNTAKEEQKAKLKHYLEDRKKHPELESFDSDVFGLCVSKVIIGSKQGDVVDPYSITFVFKSSYMSPVTESLKKEVHKASYAKYEEKPVKKLFDFPMEANFEKFDILPNNRRKKINEAVKVEADMEM